MELTGVLASVVFPRAASAASTTEGQTVPNLVIAPVGAGGIVDLHTGSAGTAKLVADLSGLARVITGVARWDHSGE